MNNRRLIGLLGSLLLLTGMIAHAQTETGDALPTLQGISVQVMDGAGIESAGQFDELMASFEADFGGIVEVIPPTDFDTAVLQRSDPTSAQVMYGNPDNFALDDLSRFNTIDTLSIVGIDGFGLGARVEAGDDILSIVGIDGFGLGARVEAGDDILSIVGIDGFGLGAIVGLDIVLDAGASLDTIDLASFVPLYVGGANVAVADILPDDVDLVGYTLDYTGGITVASTLPEGLTVNALTLSFAPDQSIDEIVAFLSAMESELGDLQISQVVGSIDFVEAELPEGTVIEGLRSPSTRLFGLVEADDETDDGDGGEIFTGQPLDGDWTLQVDPETLTFADACGDIGGMMGGRITTPRTYSVTWSNPVTWSDIPQPDSNFIRYEGSDEADGTYIQTQTDPDGIVATGVFIPVSETAFAGTITYDVTAMIANCTADGTFTFMLN